VLCSSSAQRAPSATVIASAAQVLADGFVQQPRGEADAATEGPDSVASDDDHSSALRRARRSLSPGESSVSSGGLALSRVAQGERERQRCARARNPRIAEALRLSAKRAAFFKSVR
jgi:hypothetical protein